MILGGWRAGEQKPGFKLFHGIVGDVMTKAQERLSRGEKAMDFPLAQRRDINDIGA